MFSMIKPLCATLVQLCLLVSFSALSHAAVIHVKPDGDDTRVGLTWETAKQTPQGGIDAAAPRDQVWIAAGLYRRATMVVRLDIEVYGGFRGTEVSLPERAPFPRPNPEDDDLATIIEGRDTGGVKANLTGILVEVVFDDHGVIDGFTVRGWGGRDGAGFRLRGRTTIRNCVIVDNDSQLYAPGVGSGGGVHSSGPGEITIANNIFKRNYGQFGGAVRLASVLFHLSGNLFEENAAVQGGGAAVLVKLTGEVENNSFLRNVTRDPVEGGPGSRISGSGGGLLVGTGHSAFVLPIRDNYFERNLALEGGAINAERYARIERNVFVANEARVDASLRGRGGAIFSSDFVPPDDPDGNIGILHNAFYNNLAEKEGGAVHSVNDFPAAELSRIVNNLFVANRSLQDGGAIFVGEFGGALLTNNTLVFNQAQRGGGVFIPSQPSGRSTQLYNNIAAFNEQGIYSGRPLGDLVVSHNNVFGNGQDYVGIPDQTGLNGNIKDDPLFVDIVSANFRLLSASPCIDVGLESAPGIPLVDLDHLPRRVGRVDLGAYEFQGGT